MKYVQALSQRRLDAGPVSAALAVRVTVPADQTPDSLYSALTATLSSSAVSGAFTASLSAAAVQVKSTVLLAATVAAVSSGSFTVETAPGPGPGPGPPGAQSNNDASSSKSSKALSAGLIAAGVVGALAVVALLSYWISLRRKRTSAAIAKYIEELDNDRIYGKARRNKDHSVLNMLNSVDNADALQLHDGQNCNL